MFLDLYVVLFVVLKVFANDTERVFILYALSKQYSCPFKSFLQNICLCISWHRKFELIPCLYKIDFLKYYTFKLLMTSSDR